MSEDYEIEAERLEEEGMVAIFEGWFSHLWCENCENMFELTDDVHNGEIVTCDGCNEEVVVLNR